MPGGTATRRCSPGSPRHYPISTCCSPGTAWQPWRSCSRRCAVRDVLDELMRRYSAGETVAVGTVVATFSSAPRAPGASMVVAEDGAVSGSVSGGCVEGAVYELGQQVITSGEGVLQRYGVSDDDAFAVGLTCGGIIDVYVESISATRFPELADLAKSVQVEEPVALATVVEHPDPGRRGLHLVVWPDRLTGDLGSPRSNDAVADDARGLLATGRSGLLHYGIDGQRRGEGMAGVGNPLPPPPGVLGVGAIDLAAALGRPGAVLGARGT